MADDLYQEFKRWPGMVILEGPDLAGKTTIGRAITESLCCEYRKGVRNADRYNMIAGAVSDINHQLVRKNTGGFPILQDRWPLISDVIYETFCCGMRSISEELFPIFREKMVQANMHIVILMISEQTLIERYNKRGDPERSLQELIITRQAYEEFCEDNAAWISVIHVDTDNVEQNVEKLLGAMRVFKGGTNNE